jgi:hypothetical protein
MLSERVQELLSAAVDGQLSDRERRKLDKVLRESAEARDYLHRLRQDSKRLRNLPRKTLPAAFSSQVLQKLNPAGRSSVPASVARTAQKYLPMWANLVAALAVMLALAVGTYLVVSLSEQQRARNTAEKEAKPAAPSVPLSSDLTPNIVQTPNRKTDVTPDSLPMPRPEIADDFAAIPMPELPEAPELENKSALTVPFNPKLELFKVEMPKLPPIVPIREFEQAAQRTLFVDAVKAEDAVHLDLFCKDANKSFERVLAILKSQGHRTLVEALAQYRLQARAKTNYVVFADSISSDDVVRLFTAFSGEERKTDARLMEKVVVTGMSLADQKTLGALLGIDPKSFNVKPKVPTTKLDPQKPLTDNTAENLERMLAEKNGGPKNGDRWMLALSYNPVRPNPVLSREVREYLAARKERKAGTISMMLVIRNVD